MRNNIIRLVVIVALILLIPFTAMQFSFEVQWTVSDFIFAAVLLFSTGLAYLVAARQANTVTYRIAAGLALLGAFLLIWVNGAVGIIGDGPANLLYLGVIAVAFLGTILAMLKPRGMSYALFATALAQALVPVIALIFFSPQTTSWAPGVTLVFILNAGFVVLFLGSALLFRHASLTNKG